MRKFMALVTAASLLMMNGCDAKKSASNAASSVEDAAAAKAKKIENFAKERINVDAQSQ